MDDVNNYYLRDVYQTATTVECRVYHPSENTLGVEYEDVVLVDLQRDLLVQQAESPISVQPQQALSDVAAELLQRGIEAVRAGQVQPLSLASLATFDDE